mmetsp:Transcript_21409/g.47463  ORF Transcript_21409/g.47463 Transcript_21409/m.47463 type:complete len:81 (-) Transcript_21409:1334-1576(-)
MKGHKSVRDAPPYQIDLVSSVNPLIDDPPSTRNAPLRRIDKFDLVSLASSLLSGPSPRSVHDAPRSKIDLAILAHRSSAA